MIRIVLLLLLIALPPALGENLPDWIMTRLAEPYTTISKETDAVLLFSDSQITYRNGKITSTEKRLYQILKLEGLDYGHLYLDILKGTGVSDIKGYRFDSAGVLVEKLKKENIKRFAFSDDFFDDCEQLTAVFQTIETGDFAAFEYEIREEPFFKEMFVSFGGRIETAYKRIEVPTDAQSIILNDTDHVVQRAVQPTGIQYIVKNLPAVKDEDYGPPLKECVPFVGIAFEPEPDRSWESVSRAVWHLTRDIPRVSEKTRNDLQELLSIPDKSEFIRKTFEHVSQSVRYVAVETGEGRFIPHAVDLVHQKRYGDCKDMAYYAVAILREGGVQAHPALVLTSRSGPVFDAFPSNQFNHAIVVVELDSTGIDLKNIDLDGRPCLIADPTDKHTTLPLMGDHLENTRILPITESGSTLVTLPVSEAGQNTKNYEIDISFAADRSANILVSETVTGHFAAAERSRQESIEKQKENELYRTWVQTLVPGAEMQTVSFDDILTSSNTGWRQGVLSGTTGSENSETAHHRGILNNMTHTEVLFTARNLGTDTGDGILYIPNIIHAGNKGYRRRTRESDLVLHYRSSQQIAITATVDPAFRIETIPTDDSMDNEYFTGSLKARQDGNTVNMNVQFAWKVNRITAEKYPDFRNQYQGFLKLAKSPITLRSLK